MRLADKQLEISYVPIDQLHPDPTNPNRMSDAELDALTRSLAQFGFTQPIVARLADRIVIGGHWRLLAARRLGMTVVPVVLLDVSIEQARTLGVALNNIHGSFDDALLARLLADLAKLPEIDLTVTGFEAESIAQLIRKLDAHEKRDRPERFDLDAAWEEATREPRTRRGDVWRLHDHRMACGDSTDQDDVQRLLGGARPRMAALDPPYNVSLGDHGGQQRGARRRRIANDDMSSAEFADFCRAWAQNLVSNVDGAIYCFMSTKEWPLISAVLEGAGAHWSDTIIWAKDRFALGRADYQRQYEPIWFGWREGATHHWCGDRNQSDVWQMPRPSESPLHPTMKPLALMERAIVNSSQVGDGVLDLFLGSGSTLIACERTGRLCFGMELDPRYADVAVARWESFTGETAVKEAR